MNYQKITRCDTANGPGIRTTLWVSGCSHKCKGCHNPDTHDSASGYPFTNKELEYILESLDHPHIAGLTFSGGDPLYVGNILGVTHIAQTVRETYPHKSIWVWTGYLYEQVKDHEVMNYIDVLVDGRYVESLRDLRLPYTGSSNQRVIDVVKSREANDTVLYKY